MFITKENKKETTMTQIFKNIYKKKTPFNFSNCEVWLNRSKGSKYRWKNKCTSIITDSEEWWTIAVRENNHKAEISKIKVFKRYRI